ncbi:unnamed protein product [Withania somnifera]
MLRSFDYTGSIRSVCLKNIALLAKLSLQHREYYVAAGKCNIAKFFESLSALEHLYLNDMVAALECLEVDTFNHLKEVKLMRTNGTVPEIQLMKLLLTKSPELVRILIEPCLVEESATVKTLTQLIKFQRASPKADIVYKLD